MSRRKDPNKTTSADILELAGMEEICARVKEGMTMREIMDLLGVDSLAFYKFVHGTPERRKMMEVAKEESAEAFLDRGFDVVSTSLRKASPIDPTAARNFAHECARRAALRNRRYIERTAHEHTGADGGPIQTRQLTSKEAAAVARKLMQEV